MDPLVDSKLCCTKIQKFKFKFKLQQKNCAGGSTGYFWNLIFFYYNFTHRVLPMIFNALVDPPVDRKNPAVDPPVDFEFAIFLLILPGVLPIIFYPLVDPLVD